MSRPGKTQKMCMSQAVHPGGLFLGYGFNRGMASLNCYRIYS